MAAAGQEVVGLAHQLGIAGEIDLAGAGARTAADLVEQAGPGAAFKEAVGAGADQEGALQRRDGAVDGAGGGERPEIPARSRLRAAMLENLRRPMVAGDQDIGKRLVVAQLHVEAWPQLLDEVGLEQQRLGLGRGRNDLDVHRGRDHAQDARRLGRVDAGVRGQALADVFRLADVKHVVGGIEHAVDAGRGRRQAHRIFDRGVADRKRAFGDRLGRLLRRFRQQRLVVLLDGGCRGIDVRGGGLLGVRVLGARVPGSQVAGSQVPGSQVLGRQIGSGAAPRLAWALRLIGRIVIHGPKLSAGRRHRQRGRRRGRVTSGNTFLRMMSGR